MRIIAINAMLSTTDGLGAEFDTDDYCDVAREVEVFSGVCRKGGDGDEEPPTPARHPRILRRGQPIICPLPISMVDRR
jgi:hypothetical protein